MQKTQGNNITTFSLMIQQYANGREQASKTTMEGSKQPQHRRIMKNCLCLTERCNVAVIGLHKPFPRTKASAHLQTPLSLVHFQATRSWNTMTRQSTWPEWRVVVWDSWCKFCWFGWAGFISLCGVFAMFCLGLFTFVYFKIVFSLSLFVYLGFG